MTQAPTPGPMSASGRLPKTLGQRAYEKMRDRNDNASPEMNDTLAWEKLTPGEQSVWEKDAKKRPHLYGLAPTAPVEASGSERNGYVTAFYEIADMLGIGAQSKSPAEVWAQNMRPRLQAALRPQPSGETREVAQDIASLKGQFERIFSRSPEDRPAYKDGGQPFGHGDLRHFIEVLGKAEALLSARPLALGGQQGETIEQRFPALNDHLIRMASSGSTGSLTEWGEFFECLRAALSTTPARAEASGQ